MYKRNNTILVVLFLILGDIISFFLSIFVTLIFTEKRLYIPSLFHLVFGLGITLLYEIVSEKHQFISNKTISYEVLNASSLLRFYIIGYFFVLYFTNNRFFKKLSIAAIVIVCLFFMVFCSILRSTVIRLYDRFKISKNAVLVTNADLFKECKSRLADILGKEYDLTIIVLADNDIMLKEESGEDIRISSLDQLSTIVASRWIDEAFIVLPIHSDVENNLITMFFSWGINVNVYLEVLDRKDMAFSTDIIYINNSIFVRSRRNDYLYGEFQDFSRIAKRILDILIGLIGCSVFSICFIILYPFIKISCDGPVLPSKNCIGFYGRTFRRFYLGICPEDDSLQRNQILQKSFRKARKNKNGVQQFLLKTKLYDLPVFINILKGDMSLVGISCKAMTETNYFITKCKPGVWGSWLKYDKKVRNSDLGVYDREYLSEASFYMDCHIVLLGIKEYFLEIIGR